MIHECQWTNYASDQTFPDAFFAFSLTSESRVVFLPSLFHCKQFVQAKKQVKMKGLTVNTFLLGFVSSESLIQRSLPFSLFYSLAFAMLLFFIPFVFSLPHLFLFPSISLSPVTKFTFTQCCFVSNKRRISIEKCHLTIYVSQCILLFLSVSVCLYAYTAGAYMNVSVITLQLTHRQVHLTPYNFTAIEPLI